MMCQQLGGDSRRGIAGWEGGERSRAGSLLRGQREYGTMLMDSDSHLQFEVWWQQHAEMPQPKSTTAARSTPMAVPPTAARPT